MPTTTNYGWTTPADTDLVKDGAAAIRTLGSSIDTTVFNNASAGIAKTIVDAKGDLIAATAADTVARLAVGTNGQILTADSAEATGIKWATPAASGGETLISTTTLSGSSITLSSIPQTYKDLKIVIRNFRPASDNDSIGIRFNGNSTTYSSTGANNGTSSLTSDRIYDVVTNQDNGTSTSLAFHMIFDYTNSVTWKLTNGYSLTNNATTPANYNYQRIAGFFAQTSAITSITLLANNTTFTSGTVLLYGVS